MSAEKKPEGKMDMQAMAEVCQKLATPGDPHKLLARMAGSWNTRTKCWMDPSQSPMESTGASQQRMILGGRFLQQDFAGEMMGSPFSGIGQAGYDNHTRKYVSTWMDSMGTGIHFFEGTAGADGRTITQTSRYDHPVLGPIQWRTVTRIVDDDTFMFEMYTTPKGGKEDKVMEITYARQRP
jgi:hypothetical protein